MATWAIDRARSKLFKWSGPVARLLVRDRALRVSLSLLFVIIAALAMAAVIPYYALLMGPVIFGVPHLLADVRYLVVRPGLHRRRALALALAVPLVAVALGAGIEWGLLVIVSAGLFAAAPWRRRVLAAVVGAALWALALKYRYELSLGFAHAHNFIAVLIWWFWAPRGKSAALPALLFVVLSAAILLGALDGTTVVLDDYARALAPFEGGAGPWAGRVVLLFAFAQAVHYGLWLRVIPEDDRERETPRTFRATWRVLAAELGLPLLVAITLLAVGIVAWATLDLAGARDGYLRLASFHGYLELGCVTLVLVEGRRFFASRSAR